MEAAEEGDVPVSVGVETPEEKDDSIDNKAALLSAKMAADSVA
jgi:hypothetical protein